MGLFIDVVICFLFVVDIVEVVLMVVCDWVVIVINSKKIIR